MRAAAPVQMRAPEIKELTDAVCRAREFRLHPLGFFYFGHDLEEGLTRRVHVWLPDGADPPENDLHLHSFDIDSIVVVGKLRSELFRYREVAEGTILEFCVSYNADQSTLRHTGNRGVLDTIGSFETAAGTRYRLEAGVIHRVAVVAVPCVTVLTTIERGIPIYSYGPADEKQPFVRRFAKSDEVSRIVGTLDDALGS